MLKNINDYISLAVMGYIVILMTRFLIGTLTPEHNHKNNDKRSFSYFLKELKNYSENGEE